MAYSRDPNENHGEYLPYGVEGPTVDERDELSTNREAVLGPGDRNRGDEERSDVWEEIIEEDLS